MVIKYYLISLLILISFSFGLSQNKNDFTTGLVSGLDSLGLETGDILFCQSTTLNGILTQIGTLSPFTHSAMIIKDDMGVYWLLHATDNDYAGNSMKVKDENIDRNGVILSKLEDLFNSIDGGQTAFYKKIVFRLNKTQAYPIPDNELMYQLYDRYKKHKFETSNFRFAFTALDLTILNKDILSFKNNDKIMCSEFVYLLFDEMGLDLKGHQKINEYTPKDIYILSEHLFNTEVTFTYDEGLYKISKLRSLSMN